MEAGKRTEQAKSELRLEEKEAQALTRKFQQSILSNLPLSFPLCTTDADGSAEAKLRSDSKWVAVARTHRQLPNGAQEEYVWIVPIFLE